jgi:thiamine biosynthesis protein ThiS
MEVLTINGIEKQFPDGLPSTVTELLKQLEIQPGTIVAEIDGKIIGNEKFAQTHLHSGQNIELVRFVGGG